MVSLPEGIQIYKLIKIDELRMRIKYKICSQSSVLPVKTSFKIPMKSEFGFFVAFNPCLLALKLIYCTSLGKLNFWQINTLLHYGPPVLMARHSLHRNVSNQKQKLMFMLHIIVNGYDVTNAASKQGKDEKSWLKGTKVLKMGHFRGPFGVKDFTFDSMLHL